MLLPLFAFLKQATEVSETVSRQWERSWNLFLRGTDFGGTPGASVLFDVLTKLGLTFAVGAFLLNLYGVARDLYGGKEYLVDPKIFVRPLLIAALLLNNGTLLKETLIGVHEALNDVNQQVLKLTYTGMQIDQAYNVAKGVGDAQKGINAFVGECAGTVGEQQIQCLNDALDRSIALVEDQKARAGIGGWFNEILDDLNELKNSILDDSVPFFIGDNIYWAVAAPIWEQATYGVLWAWQAAFQHAVEAVSILVAVFSPLAIGGGLVPTGGGGSIGLYFVGFFSVHLLKLGFNVMVGITAIFFVNMPIGDPLIFPFITGIFAPIFGVLIMTGGAMGLWMGMVSLANQGLEIGIKALPF